MVKILRKSYENHEAQFPRFSVFYWAKSMFRRYCSRNVKDRIKCKPIQPVYVSKS